MCFLFSFSPPPTVPHPTLYSEELLAKRGTFQVPYIEDPNTGVAMFESSAIVKYLEVKGGASSTLT